MAPDATHPLGGGLGAHWRGAGRTDFLVWAPRAEAVMVVLSASQSLAGAGASAEQDSPDPEARLVTLERGEHGYHHGSAFQTAPGDRYAYRLHRSDGTTVDRPDPASRWQPDGVHGASAIVDPSAFAWTDDGFRAPPLSEQVLYELHVGTFTSAGTFDGVVDRLDHLVELGVTTIELLPVAQFPGARNWGYDGVLWFAVQDSYGGPEGLRRLVDAAHAHGIGVILDVVYNHVGPEGNRLDDFGPYFTDRHETPWGPGLNTDGPGADGARRLVVEHAVRFLDEFHLDGFRLDAVHGIVDQSAVHLLEELGNAIQREAARHGRSAHVIAESDLSDPRLIRPAPTGLGLDAQWADDFHHAVHVALTGERDGYYGDFTGLGDLERLLRDRYAYAGRYSRHRGRTVGRPAPDLPYDRFVACVQNHDQVGNRMRGERLVELVGFEGAKLAATLLLTAPLVPMLFMGEEYGDPAPFPYFVSHGDPALVEAVRRGRRAEFASFAWAGEPPDPQAEATFASARLDLALARADGVHAHLFALYRALIVLRHDVPLLRDPAAPDPQVTADRHALALLRTRGSDGVVVAANAATEPTTLTVEVGANGWHRRFCTDEQRFGGPGPNDAPSWRAGMLRIPLASRSAVVLLREPDGVAPDPDPSGAALDHKETS